MQNNGFVTVRPVEWVGKTTEQWIGWLCTDHSHSEERIEGTRRSRNWEHQEFCSGCALCEE